MSDSTNNVITVDEIKDKVYGSIIGQCKWFNDKLGYGFITVQDGDNKGKDIFVHHSGIRPLNSNYKTLKTGEYVNFDIIYGENGLQAVNITGILGGTLICDHSVMSVRRPRKEN
jgi:CspA family cold shock protein